MAFARGLAAGTNLRQQQMMEQSKAAELQQKKSDQANKAIGDVLKVAGELGKAYQAGQSTMTPDQFAENINNIINNAVRTSQLATESGLQVTPPETIESLRNQLLATASQTQVAQNVGAAEGTKRVSQAGAVTSAIDPNATAPSQEALLASKAIVPDTTGQQDAQNQFANADKLRADYNTLTKDFRTINDSFGRIKVSAKNPTAAGDLSMIFNYMKMLDPGSVVRESEFQNAAASGSYGAQIQGMVQKALTGKRLADEIRDDFLSRAKLLYASQERNYEQLRSQYEDMAVRANLNPKDVLTEFRAGDEPATEYKVGQTIDGPDGNKYKIKTLKADGTPDDVELVK